MNIFSVASKATWIRRATPSWLKVLIRKKVCLLEYDRNVWAELDPYRYDDPVSSYKPRHPYVIGIIKQFAHYHRHYVSACRELQVAYKLLDISGSNWVDVISGSGCDAFLVWPSANVSIWKDMFDDRLKIMHEDLNKIVYPSTKELWLWESKRRTRDWLMAHNIPLPRTEVFYDMDEALSFVSRAELPLVLKMNCGASSNGVRILRDLREAKKLIRAIFRKGIVVRGGDCRDRQWGSVILQEYLPDAREWRMVRIGDSFFGHPKGRVGDFHSGSGKVLWDVPPPDLLDFLRGVTDSGNFTSMDVDVFETREGKYLVNELQAVFGASYSRDQCRVDGKAGRFIYDEASCKWHFEEGDFARNACANLRVEHLLRMLSSDPRGNFLFPNNKS